MRENSSFAPLGLDHLPHSHGLRRGLYSFAASRLETAGLVSTLNLQN